MSHYPKWKGALIIVLTILGLLFIAPNLMGENPSIQLTAIQNDLDINQEQGKVQEALKQANIPFKAITSKAAQNNSNAKILVRFPDTDTQAKAKKLFTDKFGRILYPAVTISPATPEWMQEWGLKPVTKGLDLRGGVYLLLQVDTNSLIKNQAESNLNDIRDAIIKANIAYDSIETGKNGGVIVKLKNPDDMSHLQNIVFAANPELQRVVSSADDHVLNLVVSDAQLDQLKSKAVEQNTITLRSRMNSIGVAEPSITRQGVDRITVQLPGLSDPKDAVDALSSTASLEYYLVDEEANRDQKPKFGVKFIKDDNGHPVALKRKIILSGDHIIDASAGTGQTSGQPEVNVVLDSVGAAKMANITHENLKKPMAVVYIEFKPYQEKDSNGDIVTKVRKEERVISVATIQSEFSKRFVTTGLDNQTEARKLARSLRSGALVAPVYVIEEKTVGPSAGKKNIKQGMEAILLGFVLVMLFMGVYYKKFGIVSVIALLLNVVFITALLSFIGATLTLPGIAGVVLTMGMAVDANVLIYERIREEIRRGIGPFESIKLGFDNALSTITDANLTTLIAAIILFSYGTGPIQGFAVTLAIGIVTSMFTSIVVSRFIIHLWLSKKKNLKTLSI